jgi:hypothetical protein
MDGELSVYRTAPRLSLEGSDEIPTSPDFRERMTFLMKISSKKYWKFDSIVTSRKLKVAHDPLIPPVLGLFKDNCDDTTLKNHYLSVHPRIPIAVYFLKDKPNSGWMRVIRKPEVKIVKKNKATPLFTRLVAAVTYVHVELERSQARVEDTYQVRRAIFQWLITVIFRPNRGFPIFGSIDINPGLAPWEDESHKNKVIFTPVQLKLIQYFSQPLNSLTLRETAAFVITAWYHDHNDADFQIWTKVPSVNQRKF